MPRSVTVGFLALAALAAIPACRRETPVQLASGTLHIALVPRGPADDFWKSVHIGAIKASQDLGGVEITFRAPPTDGTPDQQIALLQPFIDANYNAIILAPADSNALVHTVRQADHANIPVVILETPLAAEAGADFVSFVTTAHRSAGRMAGEKLAEVMGGKGKALLLRYQEGSAEATDRERGFLEAMAAHPGIFVIDPGRYAGLTAATAQETAESLLTVYGDVTGVFSTSESSTVGMLRALRARGMATYVRFVGFDTDREIADALTSGDIDALVVQDPVRIGYLGVKTAVEYLRGQTVLTGIDADAIVVTRDNMNRPECREILFPDTSPYLQEP